MRECNGDARQVWHAQGQLAAWTRCEGGAASERFSTPALSRIEATFGRDASIGCRARCPDLLGPFGEGPRQHRKIAPARALRARGRSRTTKRGASGADVGVRRLVSPCPLRKMCIRHGLSWGNLRVRIDRETGCARTNFMHVRSSHATTLTPSERESVSAQPQLNSRTTQLRTPALASTSLRCHGRRQCPSLPRPVSLAACAQFGTGLAVVWGPRPGGCCRGGARGFELG